MVMVNRERLRKTLLDLSFHLGEQVGLERSVRQSLIAEVTEAYTAVTKNRSDREIQGYLEVLMGSLQSESVQLEAELMKSLELFHKQIALRL